MSWSCQLVISIFTLKPHSKSRRDNCSGTIPLSSCNLGSKIGFYYSQRNRLQPILHQTLHRHTEELLVAQWSSLPKWIKAAKEQVGGSRGENPRTGVWSRAAPNSLCYTNRAIPCVKALHNVTTACLCSHTERRDCSHKYENSKGLYKSSTTLVLHVFIQPHDMVTDHITLPLDGHCFNPWVLNTWQIAQQMDKPSQSTTGLAVLLLFSNWGLLW